MQNRVKMVIWLAVFALVLNSAGLWVLYSGKPEEVSKREFTIEGVRFQIHNNGNYDENLVKTMEKSIQRAAKKINSLSAGKLPMKQEVNIILKKSGDKSIQYPAFITSTIYDPDQLYLEDWNFYEMVLYGIVKNRSKITPLVTIGLGDYLTYHQHEREMYSAHEMWIIHRRHNKATELTDLLRYDVFSKKMINVIEKKGETPATKTNYWMLASFSSYLIDTFGVEKFITLATSTNLEADLEKMYGKPLSEIEKDWSKEMNRLEKSLPKKYDQILEDDYQYWYE